MAHTSELPLQEYILSQAPVYNNDVVPPALFLPLHLVTPALTGRKVRLIGQVLHYNVGKCILILTSYPPPSSPRGNQVTQSPTLLIDISIPLLGESPCIRGAARKDEVRVMWSRESVTLNKGDWIDVVGWLEDGSEAVRKIHASGTYASPPPLILKAIRISPSRGIPSNSTIFRGQVSGWDGTRTRHHSTTQVGEEQDDGTKIAEVITFVDDSDGEATPKPKKARRHD